MAHRSRRRFSRGASSGVKNQIWTSLMMDATSIAAAGTLGLNIVEPGDWSTIDGQKATVMTIRGYLSVSLTNSLTASAEGSVLGYIATLDDAAAVTPPPDLAASYQSTTILDTFGTAVPEVAANVLRPLWNHVVHIKVKRIITARQNVVLVIKNNSVNTIEVTGVIRSLVRKND